jgi:hypothetical protein
MMGLHKQGSNSTDASVWDKGWEDTGLNGPVFKPSARTWLKTLGFGIRPAIVSSVDPPMLCFIRVPAHGKEERKHLLPQIVAQSRYIVVLFKSLLHRFFPHFKE